MKLPLAVLAVLLLVVAFQINHYAPRLPDTIATHFNASGEPDGWSPKTSFFVLYALVVLMTITPFIVLPFLLRRLPESLINLPQKGYWLAPERREETFEYIGAALLWMGVLTLMFLSHVMGVAMAANLTPEPSLDEGFFWSLGIYLALTAAWLVVFVRHFYRTEPGAGSAS